METCNNHALAAVLVKIRERMNLISDTMIEGGCEDFPAYRGFVGNIAGLAEAERIILDYDIVLTEA